MEEREERLEAAERTSRHFEIHGIDEPEHWSEEYREIYNYLLDKIRRGE